MPIWSSVDPVATVAQIAGVDAYGLISMVTERAEKVRRNKYECRQLAEHVETVGGLLHHVERDDPRIAAPLEKLEGTLREAVVLVSSCEASSYFRRFFRGAKIAEQFQRIKEKIDFYLQAPALPRHHLHLHHQRLLPAESEERKKPGLIQDTASTLEPMH
ncbi:Os06g0541600 [Oryza sativa Japonica Group]|uniref:Os06g0541600 protein n=1 Tax=Oryza sativa subsp. japonica TaxID=39947 RepID=A0A0N7KM87_ORYSJ|nr:hypothetical protein EE612_034717 [Oryza sativa]BAS98129.1 Os06g0541600 [Oryza sativa Japonica Group]